MKPFNALFVFIYYLVGFVSAILHPTEVIGMEELPRSGVLLCPNHSSNWDPILVALRAARQLPPAHYGQGGAVPLSGAGLDFKAGRGVSGQPGQ